MAQVLADRRDVDFVLFEQLGVEELIKHEKFAGLNKKTVDMTINEARNLAIKEILPTNSIGDREGVKFENGKVTVPECYHKPHKLLLEGEWTALQEDPEYGGQGLPSLVARAALEYLFANYCLANYGIMGHGTGKMVELYGTDKQKEVFLKKLYSGEWGGTMLLTEPEAGSDVGALTSSAVKNADGTYSITGQKIFITNGEHDLTDNIIHPVLARIEGAPAGTKGISIFIVPKIWVNEDGSMGEPNDIVCTGVEEKMGIHSSSTCVMAMGSKGKCRGLLLGQENEGMKVMFHMMNEARLNVGFQGFCYGAEAYLYAVNYARERIQGRDLVAGKDRDAQPVAIINHPDVRRMLLWMKSHVDGMRSLTYYVSKCFDMIETEQNAEKQAIAKGFTELLTPIVKAYCSQRGFEVCSMAMQVYGGYGYTREYPVEQLTRDCRITSIYEGTDGIQAMDLLGRKLGMEKGKIFMNFIDEIKKIISQSKTITGLEKMADDLEKALVRFAETASHIGSKARSENFKTAYAFAHPFLEVMGDMTMAWMLLWRASIAAPKVDGGKKKDVDFYQGQVMTAKFFIETVLPGTLGRMDAITASSNAAVEISNDAFGGL
ncbi:MAG: acyl-CoA dehydrogenase [Proteobacteria bacterium]|nr:acyl-CoA dehydrogenase [Pseudomonadota bacterium]